MQVMTSEDWQTLMMSTVRATDTSAVFFFLVWIIVSKYMFLMLFLAVAMEAFERSYQEMEPELTAVADTQPVACHATPRDPDETRRSLLNSMMLAFEGEAQLRRSTGLGVESDLPEHAPGPYGSRAAADSGAPGRQPRSPVPQLDLRGVAVPAGHIADRPSQAPDSAESRAAMGWGDLTSTSVSDSDGTTARGRTRLSSEIGFLRLSGAPVCESRRTDSMALRRADEEAMDTWLAGPTAAPATPVGPLSADEAGVPSSEGAPAASAASALPHRGALQRLMQGHVLAGCGGASAWAVDGWGGPRGQRQPSRDGEELRTRSSEAESVSGGLAIPGTLVRGHVQHSDAQDAGRATLGLDLIARAASTSSRGAVNSVDAPAEATGGAVPVLTSCDMDTLEGVPPRVGEQPADGRACSAAGSSALGGGERGADTGLRAVRRVQVGVESEEAGSAARTTACSAASSLGHTWSDPADAGLALGMLPVAGADRGSGDYGAASLEAVLLPYNPDVRPCSQPSPSLMSWHVRAPCSADHTSGVCGTFMVSVSCLWGTGVPLQVRQSIRGCGASHPRGDERDMVAASVPPERSCTPSAGGLGIHSRGAFQGRLSHPERNIGDESDDEFEGQQRARFRHLLNQIRFTVCRPATRNQL